MSDKLNWPRKGNKAFGPATGTYFHVPSVLSFRQSESSFKEAAEILIDKIVADGNQARNDIFLFPVLYLYRHAVELKLKSLIWLGIALEFFEKDKVEDELAGHNLARLWTKVRTLLVHFWPNGPEDDLKAVDSVINELHSSDPNGQMFRYDSDKNGKRYEHENLPEFIGLRQLKETMDGVFNLFDGSSDGLAAELESRPGAAW